MLIGTLPGTLGAKPQARPRSSAADALAASGEWLACQTTAESKAEGDTRLLTFVVTEKLLGTLTGSFEGTERRVVKKEGSASFNGSGMFSGEANGRAGSAVMTYSGTIDVEGHAVAHWVLDKGIDGLARVDGHGTFEGKPLRPAPEGCTDTSAQSALGGTYTGTLQLPGG